MSSVDTTATNATNVVDFPNTPVSLKNNNFIAKDIRAFIDANIHLFREERLHIGGTLIVIYTVLNGQREPPGLASIAAKIYTKVYGFRSSSAKPVPLVCYLFLLDYPKRLDVSKSDITSEECNSGSTTFNLREKGEKGEKGYKFTEVVVWRQEEWEKVFYHELIHAFHIDTFVLPPQPKMDAKLHKRLAFYNDTIQEAYAEVLATVLALACGDKKVTDWKDDIIFMGSQVNKIIYFYHSVHNGHEDKLKELAKNKTPPKPLSANSSATLLTAAFWPKPSSTPELTHTAWALSAYHSCQTCGSNTWSLTDTTGLMGSLYFKAKAKSRSSCAGTPITAPSP